MDWFDMLEHGPWELPPKWHPMRWFGFVRRQVEEDLSGMYHFWQYRRAQRVAREMLQRTYDPTPAIGSMDMSTGRVWNGVKWVSGILEDEKRR